MTTLDKEAKFQEQMQRTEFKQWYDGRPPAVQELCRKLPFEIYRIKANAPYAISSPGTIVHMRSFRENGDVTVVVLPQDLREDAKSHILEIMMEKDRLDKYEAAIKIPVAAVVHSRYLEELTLEEYEKHLPDNEQLQ